MDSILKSRAITLPTKVRLVKAMVFPVVMYGYESWTVKKAECRRIDAFELWCWRRLLRVSWTATRSNQSILMEISPGISLEAMMLKLKLQYFGDLMQRLDSLEKTDAGRDWEQEEKGMTEDEMAGWHHRLDGCESEWTPGVGDGQGGLACCDSWGCKELDTTEQLNWTEPCRGCAVITNSFQQFLVFSLQAQGGLHLHAPWWLRGAMWPPLANKLSGRDRSLLDRTKPFKGFPVPPHPPT